MSEKDNVEVRLDPTDRTWEYDGYGNKVDKKTGVVVEAIEQQEEPEWPDNPVDCHAI